MMTTKIKLPVTLMRGGTSKGAYLLRKDMPPERKDWDSVLLKLMGSPDRKQIDGLGGVSGARRLGDPGIDLR